MQQTKESLSSVEESYTKTNSLKRRHKVEMNDQNRYLSSLFAWRFSFAFETSEAGSKLCYIEDFACFSKDRSYEGKDGWRNGTRSRNSVRNKSFQQEKSNEIYLVDNQYPNLVIFIQIKGINVFRCTTVSKPSWNL